MSKQIRRLSNYVALAQFGQDSVGDCGPFASAIGPIAGVVGQVGHSRHGHRLTLLIVVPWRADLRIREVRRLNEVDQRRGSVSVRDGKNDRWREVGMDVWEFGARAVVRWTSRKDPAAFRERRQLDAMYTDEAAKMPGVRRVRELE